MTDPPAIRTDGLAKRYGDVTALADLDLQVERGEVFGFLGPNGAGKTTTIDLLLDYIRPTEGSAEVLGHDAQAEADAIRQRVGVLPDGFDLWERSSGYRHLEFAIDSKGGDRTPEELLDRVGLDEAAAKRRVGGYSKGMLQRLAMAMALVGDPDVLILDEPSSGLDPNGIRTMQELVREEAERGTTVFFSSHILGQVAAVCDRVGILNEGELVTVDTIAGLRERAGVGSRLVLRVDREPAAAGVDVAAVDGVTAVEYDDGELAVTYADPAAKATVVHRLVDAGVAVHDFDVEEATLDDLFAAFTNGAVPSGGGPSARDSDAAGAANGTASGTTAGAASTDADGTAADARDAAAADVGGTETAPGAADAGEEVER